MKYFIAIASLLLMCCLNTVAQFEGRELTKIEKKAYSLFGDLPAGIQFLTQTIEKGEDLFEAYQLRSRFYVRAKEYDLAISDLDSALKIRPDDSYTYFRRAEVRSTYKTDYPDALKDLDLAERYGYDRETVMLTRASIKEDMKDLAGAVAEYNSLLFNPDSINGAMQLSKLTFEKIDQNKAIEQLRGFLEDLVKRRGKLPKVIGESTRKAPPVSKGEKHPVISNNVVSYSANSPKQLEQQKREMDLARDFADAQVFLALMQIKQGNLEKALPDLDRALEVDKNNYNAFGLKGKIYLEKRDYEKAIDNLSEAVHRANVPLLYIDRGIAYLLMGKDREAQKDFKKVLLLCSDCKAELDLRIAAAKKLLK
jgi:tetratricopeptide (TPR) repeat protein